jgi:hypothetical protein
MNLLSTTTRFALTRLIIKPSAAFAGDSWKDRDEAA